MARAAAVAERATAAEAAERAAAREALDRQARRYLGISGAEFVRRWKSGYWPEPDRVPGVTSVSMLLFDDAG